MFPILIKRFNVLRVKRRNKADEKFKGLQESGDPRVRPYG